MKNNLLKTIWTLILLFGITGLATAQDVHNQTQNTFHFTIQEAIDAANDDDVIFAPAGTYTENISFAGKNGLVLRGQQHGVSAGPGGARDESSVVDETIIDGTITTGSGTSGWPEGLTLDGLRLENMIFFQAIRVRGDVVITNVIAHFTSTYFMISVAGNAGMERNLTLSNSNINGQRGFSTDNARVLSLLVENNVFNTTAASLLSASALDGVATITGNVFNSPRGINILTNDNTVTDNVFNTVDGAGNRAIDQYEVTGNTFTGNEFYGDAEGIRVVAGGRGEATLGNTISENKFESTTGINNTLTKSVNATHNWWGDATGPTHATNPTGTGAIVTDFVDFVPWYVDDNFTCVSNAAVENITQSTLHCSIQDAIDAANDDDVIFAPAGTYNENVSIPPGTSGLVLRGANWGNSAHPDHAAARGPESVINGNVTVGVSQGATNITIDGFEIQSGASNGVAVRGPGMTVINNVIEGLAVYPTSGTAAGIRISDSAPVGPALSFDFSNNHISGYRYGFLLDGGSARYDASGVSSIISGNYVTNNERAVQSFGAMHGGGLVHQMTNNTFTANNRGIRLAGGQFNISGNIISGNDLFGINPLGGANLFNLSITDNEITNNNLGIVIDGASIGSDVFAHNNLISGNVTSGVSNGNTASDNFDATLNFWGHNSGPSGGETDPNTGTVANGSGDSVSANVLFDPWIGKLTTLPITGLGEDEKVEFVDEGVTFVFTKLPSPLPPSPEVSIAIYEAIPPGMPAPPSGLGTVLDVYLIIASNLPNFTFNVTVTIDVSTYPGFGPDTVIMYYSQTTSSWTSIPNGVYDPIEETFTFETNHFTPFIFINPDNPIDVFVALDADATANRHYRPDAGTGDVPALIAADYNNGTNTLKAGDWSYETHQVDFYIVPVGIIDLISAEFTIEFETDKATFVDVQAGNLLTDSFSFNNLGDVGGKTLIEVSASDVANQTLTGTHYIAVITLELAAPGLNVIELSNTDFRTEVGMDHEPVFAHTYPGSIQFFPGDFNGNGTIEFTSLAQFASSYFSVAADDEYFIKYDLASGPADFMDMPDPDGEIGFDDLSVFTQGYLQHHADAIPQPLNIQEPVQIKLTEPEILSGGNVRFGILFEGDFTDVRMFSLTMPYNQQMELGSHMFNKAPGFESVFAASRSHGGSIQFDVAVLDTDMTINAPGVVGWITFKANGASPWMNIEDAKARDSFGNEVPVLFGGATNIGPEQDIPMEYALGSNYPNPFNPTTNITFALPQEAHVTIEVYNVVGQRVATLVNGTQTAGYHTVTFDATRLASGVYVYRMNAGGFVQTRKMLLVK